MCRAAGSATSTTTAAAMAALGTGHCHCQAVRGLNGWEGKPTSRQRSGILGGWTRKAACTLHISQMGICLS